MHIRCMYIVMGIDHVSHDEEEVNGGVLQHRHVRLARMQHVAPIVFDEDPKDGQRGFHEAIELRERRLAGLAPERL